MQVYLYQTYIIWPLLEKPNKNHRIGGAFFWVGVLATAAAAAAAGVGVGVVVVVVVVVVVALCHGFPNRQNPPMFSSLQFAVIHLGGWRLCRVPGVGGWCWYEPTIATCICFFDAWKKSNKHILPNGGISVKSQKQKHHQSIKSNPKPGVPKRWLKHTTAVDTWPIIPLNPKRDFGPFFSWENEETQIS